MPALEKDTKLVMTILFVGCISGINVFFYAEYGNLLAFSHYAHAVVFSLMTIGGILVMKAVFDLALNDYIEMTLLDRRIAAYQAKTKFGSLLNTLRDNTIIRSAFRSSLNFLEVLDSKVFHLDIQKDIQISESVLKKGGSLNLKTGKESFVVKIPSGDWKKMSLIVSGKGERSLFSQRRGDLLLKLRVPRVEKTKADSHRFYYEMKIPKTADRRVMTLNSSEGPIKFILPSNTRDGQSFTLRSGLGGKSETLHILTVRMD